MKNFREDLGEVGKVHKLFYKDYPLYNLQNYILKQRILHQETILSERNDARKQPDLFLINS